MKRVLFVVPVLAAGIIAGTLFFSWSTTRAVQNPTISLDMIIAGTTYDDTTNTMTVGTIDNCLADAVPNTATHTHLTQLVVQNVEDLVGWQVRMNYIGDRMRPQSFNATPFMDTTTGDQIGFANLPIDTATTTHRGVITASSIPPGAAGAQTALIGATYNGGQDFSISPDTPAKSPAEIPAPNYNAPSGGVLANLNLQVVGDQSGQTLQMDLSTNVPNPPGSKVTFFNGTGTTDILLADSSLIDGFHAEGLATCGAVATPTETPTASPTATESPPPTPSPTAAPTPTVTPIGQTPTRTPTPGAGAGSAGASGTATRTATPRVSPAALPPTGNGNDGGTSVIAYILLVAAVSVPVTAAGYKIWRLRRR